MQKVLFGGETWHWSQHIRNSSNCFCKRAVTHNNGAKGKKKRHRGNKEAARELPNLLQQDLGFELQTNERPAGRA